MNGPKLVAEILVVVIIVGCCYSVFSEAIPTEYPPVDIKADESTKNELSYSGMEVTIKTQSYIIDSKMPSDITDVYIELALDAPSQKYHLGTIDIGTISANATTHTERQTITVPAYVILASLASNSDGGTIKTPILAKLHFSYLEYRGEKLIDLGLNLRVDMGFDGGVKVEHDGNTAKMTIDVPDSGFTKDIVGIADRVCDSEGNCTLGIEGCPDVGFKLNVSPDGKTVSFAVSGVDGTAYDVMNSFFKDKDEVTINYKGSSEESYTVTKEQAESFSKVIESFYGGISA